MLGATGVELRLLLRFLGTRKKGQPRHLHLMKENGSFSPPARSKDLGWRGQGTQVLWLHPSTPLSSPPPSPVLPAAPAHTPGNPPLMLIQDRVKGSSFSQEQHMFPTNVAFIASHYNCLAACALHWAECILIYLNE